jgi:plasmid stability protein
MPTLYVENVPEDLYEALRSRARASRRSIAAEILALLEANIPTEKELKSRQQFLRKVRQIQLGKHLAKGPFPSTEEMLREDRER